MAKSDLKRVLIDSCALLAFIKGEPAAARLIPLMGLVDRGEVQLVASVLTLAEVYKQSTAPDEAERNRQNAKLKHIRLKLTVTMRHVPTKDRYRLAPMTLSAKCVRCGIDMGRPGMCLDCLEVTGVSA